MMNNPLWQDDYWLLLLQLYLKKPVGLKPVYSRDAVSLALSLHIEPKDIHDQMKKLRRRARPSLQRLWQLYGNRPRKLQNKCKLVKKLAGLGGGSLFYDGVELNETWEKNFEPVAPGTTITPMMLIIILDLYFCLSPLTMVPETPDIVELAQLMHVSADTICSIMDTFQYCDPYLRHKPQPDAVLLPACKKVWQQYSAIDSDELSQLASDLKQYFIS